MEEFHSFLRVRHEASTPSTSCVCHLGVALYVYDLADPVSSGKYSGTVVFTAPVVKPTVVSYTVPLVGCTIVAIATIVTSCSSAALFQEGVCVAMLCGGGFSLLVVLTILFGTL